MVKLQCGGKTETTDSSREYPFPLKWQQKAAGLEHAHREKTDVSTVKKKKKQTRYQSTLRSRELSIDPTVTAQAAFFPKANFKGFSDSECESGLFFWYDNLL